MGYSVVVVVIIIVVIAINNVVVVVSVVIVIVIVVIVIVVIIIIAVDIAIISIRVIAVDSVSDLGVRDNRAVRTVLTWLGVKVWVSVLRVLAKTISVVWVLAEWVVSDVVSKIDVVEGGANSLEETVSISTAAVASDDDFALEIVVDEVVPVPSAATPVMVVRAKALEFVPNL